MKDENSRSGWDEDSILREAHEVHKKILSREEREARQHSLDRTEMAKINLRLTGIENDMHKLTMHIDEDFMVIRELLNKLLNERAIK